MGMKSMTMFVVLTVMILLTSGSVVRTEIEQAHNDSVNDLDRYLQYTEGSKKSVERKREILKYFLMESFYIYIYIFSRS